MILPTYNAADQRTIRAATHLELSLIQFIDRATQKLVAEVEESNVCPYCGNFLNANGTCLNCETDEI